MADDRQALLAKPSTVSNSGSTADASDINPEEPLARIISDVGFVKGEFGCFARNRNFIFNVLFGIFAVVLMVVLVVVIAIAIKHKGDKSDIPKLLLEEIQAENIRDNLINITHYMHLAGTKESLHVADLIRDRWLAYGFDHVETPEYDVLLSYPDFDQPNTVNFVDSSGKVLDVSTGLSEYLLDEEMVSPGANIQWNAYAHEGSVTTNRIVYANYGRVTDFEYLVKQMGITINGSIVLARYGELWRGAKVQNAQAYGAAGVILYTDPMDYANGTDPSAQFPYSVFMPPHGTQRGSVAFQVSGDPLTPLLPAKNYTWRRSLASLYEEGILSKIPVTPISYAAAKKIFDQLGGKVAPGKWRGGLNVTYHVGPDITSRGRSLQLNVHVKPDRRIIRNVIGYIRGAVEPGKYVLVGNHHDAWVYGAMDPSSGTAVMLEMGRAFKAVMNATGWRPRRTIVFCSWDAEEPGLIGSGEWVEENLHLLLSRGVAYLNMDIAVYAVADAFRVFFGISVPLLEGVMFNATKMVPEPGNASSGMTVYDLWLRSTPDNKTGRPEVALPGSASDYYFFVDYVGVPATGMDYGRYKGTYPLYHSLYETPFVYENISDPQFDYNRAMGQIWSQMLFRVADSTILPFSVDIYGDKMKGYTNSLVKDAPELDLGQLVQATDDFQVAAHSFQQLIYAAEKEPTEIEVRILNDVLMNVERSFLEPGGLPNRPTARHIVFAPSLLDSYSAETFAGIRDCLAHVRNQTVHTSGAVAGGRNWTEALQQQISWAIYSVKSATNLLTRVI